jgi:beta-mannosidase
MYEDDALFDACDEMGICVWLDFKFACTAYPAFDDAFMENVKREARDNLFRLRHHPCIAVWCGNNEISLSWWKGPTWATNRMNDADYDKLFVALLAEQVRRYAPQAGYVSGSPDCGDTHYWDVWHGSQTFEAYRTQNGFMSEFGFQSFPEPKTVHAFTNESDRASVITPVMNWHQRSGGLEANQKIVGMILHYFQPPRGVTETLWLSQILQGYGIKIGAEYWRQTRPKSMGCIYWQYNDTWPGMSWSSVDYFGRWKALHYFARRFYAPVLVSGVEDVAAGTADIFISSDRREPERGRLRWRVTDLGGKTLLQEQMDVVVPPLKSQKVKTLDMQHLLKRHGAAGILTWLHLELDGGAVSENLLLFALPKELTPGDPGLTSVVQATADGFLVTVQAKKPSLWAWLDLENLDA